MQQFAAARNPIHSGRQDGSPVNSALPMTPPRMMKFPAMIAAALAGALLLAGLLAAQQTTLPQEPLPEAEKTALLTRAVANEKKNELAQDLFERIERREILHSSGNPQPAQITTVRAIPAGTGVARLPVGPDGAPADPAAYREALQRLSRTLEWAAGDGPAQREAYARVTRKHNERISLIDTAASAFVYTLASRELRGGHVISKVRFDPNPAFKPTSRTTSYFPKVSGFLWIDEAGGQILRIEGSLIEDIPIGLFLAKIYKGTRFAQERTEVEPGVWLPALTEYDYSGRKLFSPFAVHERTIASRYRRIGPPGKALELIRTEIGDSGAAQATKR
ncbi:MAG: hypothetical protein LAN71_04480 [Acidobacteriia bacterium]|nr:hypothetical protein [Terriglobia bacterium]